MARHEETHRPDGPKRSRLREGPASFLAVVGALVLCWLVLSDKTDLFHLSLGAGSAIAAAALSYRVLFLDRRRGDPRRDRRKLISTLAWLRLPAYFTWLTGQVVVANLQVIRRILHPRLPIAPRILRIRTDLQGDLARSMLGNSITLTPGTVTLDIVDDELVLHTLDPELAGKVLSGEMGDRVGALFAPEALGRPRERPREQG